MSRRPNIVSGTAAAKTKRSRTRIKTGRRAGAEERARAQALVDCYRREVAAGRCRILIEDMPGGEYMVDDRAVMSCLSTLVRALERFAAEGTFAFDYDWRSSAAQAAAARAGRAYAEQVAAVAESMNCSERTAERLIASFKAPA